MFELIGRLCVRRPVNRVREKMLHPQRTMCGAAVWDLKAEIRKRLKDRYGYREGFGRLYKPKPRVRYKLTLRRWPVVYTLRPGVRYEMFEYVYMLLLCSVFFLSSTPVEANGGSISQVVHAVPDLRTGVRGPVHSRWAVPQAIKTPSPFVTGTPAFKYRVDFPRVPSETSILIAKAYLRLIDEQIKYEALVRAPRRPGKDWRKFWLSLGAIGGAALLAFFALVRGYLKSVRQKSI